MRVNRKFEGNVGVRVLQFRGGKEGFRKLDFLVVAIPNMLFFQICMINH